MRFPRVAVLTALLVVWLATPAVAVSPPQSAAEVLGGTWRAYEQGDYQTVLARRGLRPVASHNRDYALWALAEASYYTGDWQDAEGLYFAVQQQPGSRFTQRARWRQADAQWASGRHKDAAAAYQKLRGSNGGDDAVASYRLALYALESGKRAAALSGLRALALDHAEHPLADSALARLAEEGAPPLSPRERISRAASLTAGRDWTRALDELALVPAGAPKDIRRLHDFHLGNTLFKMRRQYARAGELLLSVWQDMGPQAAYALFHGARGMSRGDRDDLAIGHYRELVKRYPKSEWAAEASYLIGWLEFNRGNYRAALPGLEDTFKRYGKSKFADDALWHLAFSHFLLGELDRALALFERLARQGGALTGGKGRYWHARALQLAGKKDAAVLEWRALVGDYPLTWYAILARARLAEAGVSIGAWGDAADEAKVTAAAGQVPVLRAASLTSDPLLLRVDELLAAGMTRAAEEELEAGERAFIKRVGAAVALPVLFDRYDRAQNFNRPWVLAEGYGGRALDAKPEGNARVYWEHAYPRAYQAWVERYQALGQNPPNYLYAIMLKESGFKAHDVSYADAIGLMQMIPPTTMRVTGALGMPYTDDLLYDPEKNIQVASWYVGRLLQKFKGQIPVAAGSYNGGPRSMMRWLDKYPERPMDELVELAAFSQTREYMKKVTGIYAHYLMLYQGQVYEQPLTVDAAYLRDDVNY